MFKRIALASAALTLLAAPALEAQDAQQTKGEAQLAKLLEGRVAGEPKSYINTIGSRGLTVIDKTALVYKSGKTIWVNYTAHPETIDDNDLLVIRKFGGSQLCKLDNVTTYDRMGMFMTGVVFLDDFVPYTKVDAS